MITARSQYDDRPALTSDLSFEGDKGVTKQADLRDADINLIFKRFEKTGQLPDLILKNGHYGDFSSVPDYQESLEIVRNAQNQFDALDVNLRNRFENDPAKFLEFVSNPANADELEKMGLLKPEAVEARAAAREAANKKAVEDQKKAADQAEKDLIAKIKASL